MDIGITGFELQDPGDFERFLNGGYSHWDYVDESLTALKSLKSAVIFYLADTPQGREQLEAAGNLLTAMKAGDRQNELGSLEYGCETVAEESWESNWKKYYKPFKIGKKLAVCPTWEKYAAKSGEAVIRLDPGMAFGSGTHESTRLCLELLQENIRGGELVLDLGCGSGILSIAALLLGAKNADLTDIDEAALKVARENAATNGVEDRAGFFLGSLASGINGKYGIVLANIVADVILELIPDLDSLLCENGVFIASGIIDARAAEIEGAVLNSGYIIREKIERNGWVAYLAAR